MFTHAGNARTTTGTLEYLATVYPTIKTVEGNPVKLVIALAVTGKENLFDLEVDLQEIELSSLASFPTISQQTPPEFDLDSIPTLCKPWRF